MNALKFTVTAMATGLALASGITAPAFAHDTSADNADPVDATTINALVKHNPGSDADEITQIVEQMAQKSDSSAQEVANQMLAEAEASAKAASGSRLRSSGGGTVTLANANQIGDIFISPASTLFIEHGHTGIYYAKSSIVEAPGLNQKSRAIGAGKVKVGKGTVLQYVRGIQSVDAAKAGKYAYDKLRNKPYNTHFASNKDASGSSMNCSQLVWAAYKKALSIDLDGNGGSGVYPYDIKGSSRTATYKTL
ncbi:MAG: hypothetical protein LBR20_05030 [Propionibacteriaceae bacterium]|jgi:uncharacterized protein YycO|nr:hypothetical protein [Propionibacteriaceae bacterium]